MRPPTRNCARRPPPGRPPPARPTRRMTTGRETNPPGTSRPPPWPVDVLEELAILDALAERVSGDMINAGIATIDTRWTAGQDLQRPLETYRGLALRASPQYTAGLWTLVAWIHWRTGNRAEAWPALQLAMKIDIDIAAAHYLTVFMHRRTDPHTVPPITYR